MGHVVVHDARVWVLCCRRRIQTVRGVTRVSFVLVFVRRIHARHHASRSDQAMRVVTNNLVYDRSIRRRRQTAAVKQR